MASPSGEFFAEKHPAHEHVEQGSDEVSERGFHDPAAGDGQKIHAPVDSEQQGCGKQGEHHSFALECRPHGMELMRGGKHDAEKDHSPDHAVRHDGNGIQPGEQRPEQYGDAPQKVRAETGTGSRAGAGTFAGVKGHMKMHHGRTGKRRCFIGIGEDVRLQGKTVPGRNESGGRSACNQQSAPPCRDGRADWECGRMLRCCAGHERKMR